MKKKNPTIPKAKPSPKPPANISPGDLAILAALLNPAGCKAQSRNERRSALCDALILWQESAMLAEELGPILTSESVGAFCDAPMNQNNEGARKLCLLLLEGRELPEAVLTLGRRDQDADTLRPYLAEHANFEGKNPERKQWSNVRTVWNNFEKFLVAGQWARERGISRLEAWRERSNYSEKIRQAGKDELEEMRSEAKRCDEDGKLINYEIPEALVEGLIRWKRDTRRKSGSISPEQPRTLAEIIREGCKKSFPKKST